MKKIHKIFLISALCGLSLTSCEDDGTKVELDMSNKQEAISGNFYQTGYNKGVYFAKGLNAIKDTLTSANRAYAYGYEFNETVFKGKMVGPVSMCEAPYRSYFAEGSLQTEEARQWVDGFFKATIEGSPLADSASVASALEFYSYIDLHDMKSTNNIRFIILMGTLMGVPTPKIIGYND